MRDFEDHQKQCVTQKKAWALDPGLGLNWEIWTMRAGVVVHVTCPLLTSAFLNCGMGVMILPWLL